MLKFTNSNLVTCGEIAIRLGVVSESWRPHARIIGALLTHLGIKPDRDLGNRNFLYKDEVVAKLREWFYLEIDIELSDLSIPVTVGKAVYQVKFLAVTKQDKLTFAAREIVA